MKPPAPLPTTADIADDHLAPIRAYVHANHGSITLLASVMSEMTRTKITRHAVSRWMNKTPGIRQEPKLGVGLLLEQAYQKILSKTEGQ